jgi:hypothetical protein
MLNLGPLELVIILVVPVSLKSSNWRSVLAFTTSRLESAATSWTASGVLSFR